MAKDKVKRVEEKNDYFYEIFGIFAIIMSLIILGNLGKFGSILNLCLKLLVGDFSFLLTLLFLFTGIKSIKTKKILNIHSLAFQGFLCLTISLLILSHLALYDGLGMTSSNTLTRTFSLYKSYLKYYDNTMVTGGGIIGAIFFQILIFLFGKIGIIVIAIALIILGATFIFNTSFIDMILNGKKVSGIAKKGIDAFFNYFKKIEYKPKKIASNRSRPLNLSLLSDVNSHSSDSIQNMINDELQNNLVAFIRQNNLPIIYEKYLIGFNHSRFLFTLIGEGQLKIIFEKLNYFFEHNSLLFVSNGQMYADLANKFKELLTLKHLLSKEELKDNYLYLGLEVNNEVLKLDLVEMKMLVIAGDHGCGIRNFIKGLIVACMVKHQHDFEMDLLDVKKDFFELNMISNSFNYYISSQEGIGLIDNLCIEYERRRELLKYLEADNIFEANHEIELCHPKINKIIFKYVVINTNLSKVNYDIVSKLNYLIKFAYKVGIFIIVIGRTLEDFDKLLITGADIMCFHTNNLELSLKLINNEYPCCLQKKGDFLLKKENKIRHGQTGYLSTTDYQKFLKKFIF